MCKMCLSRRGMLGAIAASAFVAAAGPAPPSTISGDEALHRLVEGNARYVANKLNVRDFAAGRAARVATHRPVASILSCSDARVGPEFLFDQGPGALFVVRVAGNVLEDEGLASLEYAGQFLSSPLIFVLGHSGCGAVDAAVKVVTEKATLPGHLPGLIEHIEPAVLAAQKTNPKDLLAAAIRENVKQTMAQVSGAAPVLSDLVSAGKVKVAGGVYDIGTGKVTRV